MCKSPSSSTQRCLIKLTEMSGSRMMAVLVLDFKIETLRPFSKSEVKCERGILKYNHARHSARIQLIRIVFFHGLPARRHLDRHQTRTSLFYALGGSLPCPLTTPNLNYTKWHLHNTLHRPHQPWQRASRPCTPSHGHPHPQSSPCPPLVSTLAHTPGGSRS